MVGGGVNHFFLSSTTTIEIYTKRYKEIYICITYHFKNKQKQLYILKKKKQRWIIPLWKKLRNIYDVCNIFPMFQCIVSYLKTHDVLNLMESFEAIKIANGGGNVYDEYMERLIRGPQQLLALYRRYR